MKSKDYWALIQQSFSLFGQTYGVLRMKSKQVRYKHLLKRLRGCAVSVAASLCSGLGTATGMFKLKRFSAYAIEDFLTDVESDKGRFPIWKAGYSLS